jgi:hypothetical protein
MISYLNLYLTSDKWPQKLLCIKGHLAIILQHNFPVEQETLFIVSFNLEDHLKGDHLKFMLLVCVFAFVLEF